MKSAIFHTQILKNWGRFLHNTTMEYLTNAYNQLYNSIATLDYKHTLRLTIIICAYVLFRGIASRELTKREINRKIQQDNQDKADKLVDKVDEKEIAEASAFGWGKKTRKRVARQQKMLEEKLDELKEKGGWDHEDDDIADLLEDD